MQEEEYQISKKMIKDILPYLEWIDLFHEIKFKSTITMPIQMREYNIRTYFLDVGYLQWYSKKIGKMIAVPFCSEMREVVGRSVIKSSIGSLLHEVNVPEEFQGVWYLYRVKNGQIKDAIRISLKRCIDPREWIPRGFRISERYMNYNDTENLADIQRQLDAQKSIVVITTPYKKEPYLQLISSQLESSILIRGTIPNEIVKLCEQYGYQRTSKEN